MVNIGPFWERIWVLKLKARTRTTLWKLINILWKCLLHTERNNPENIQYERFFNLREDFTYTLHDFTCMLLSVTVQDVESTVQDVKTKGNPVNLMSFSYWRFSNKNTYFKLHEFILAATMVFFLCMHSIWYLTYAYLLN